MGQLSSAIQVTNGRRYGSGRYRYRQALRSPVLVLHTIEGSLSYDTARRHENPPHLWYSPSRRELFQTADLFGPAFALRHPSGTPETNNRGPCLQVELEGYARDTRSWPDEYYANIAQDVVRPLDRFCREIYGQTLVGGPTTRGLVYADELDPFGPLATTTSPLRMSAAQWNDAHGLVGHQHVPFNTHWDPGRFRIDTLLRYLSDLDEPRVLKLLSGGQRVLRGSDVQDWQSLLVTLGFLAAADVDGLFGPQTDAATRRFQESAGLPVDGVVTTAVAIAAANPPKPTPAPVPPAEVPSSSSPPAPPEQPIVDITDPPPAGGRPPIDATREAVATAGGTLAAPAVAEPWLDVRAPNVEQQPSADDEEAVPSTAPPAARQPTQPTPAPTSRPTPTVATPTATATPSGETESATPDSDDLSFMGRIMAWIRRLFGGS